MFRASKVLGKNSDLTIIKFFQIFLTLPVRTPISTTCLLQYHAFGVITLKGFVETVQESETRLVPKQRDNFSFSIFFESEYYQTCRKCMMRISDQSCMCMYYSVIFYKLLIFSNASRMNGRRNRRSRAPRRQIWRHHFKKFCVSVLPVLGF